MNAAFWIISGIAVLGALLAVTLRNLVHCVLALILFFLGIAGHYFLLRADFLGAVQILIYIGAVAVLILFAIMLTRNVTGTAGPRETLGGKWWVGAATATIVAAVVVAVTRVSALAALAPAAAPASSVRAIGQVLMADWVVPLEAIAVLLTAALIGAVVIALEEVRAPAMSIPLGHYLALSAVLFAVGLAGALTRRNAIIVLMAIEIMFNAAILNLVVFWHYKLSAALTAQMFAIFAIGIAAAESAVGLALVIAVYRHYQSVDVEQMASLKG